MKSVAVLWLMMGLSLAACQQGNDYQPSAQTTQTVSDSLSNQVSQATRPQPRFANTDAASLNYFESRAFDSDLADALHAGVKQVTVTIPAPFAVDAVPERLDRWLYAVKDSGGRVVAEALPPKDTQIATRSILPLLLEVVIPLLAKAMETDIHDYAKGYNATLFFAPEDGRVQKLVFAKTP